MEKHHWIIIYCYIKEGIVMNSVHTDMLDGTNRVTDKLYNSYLGLNELSFFSVFRVFGDLVCFVFKIASLRYFPQSPHPVL